MIVYFHIHFYIKGLKFTVTIYGSQQRVYKIRTCTVKKLNKFNFELIDNNSEKVFMIALILTVF